MNSELISIVIPVYNVEKYLERCVESVLKQTYRNIEIILVDDGSGDSSGDICNQIAKNDSRVKVYHKKNGGASDARNYGIERVSGFYIAFIDADDYVAPNYIEYLYDLIKKQNSDISCCCFTETEHDSVVFGVNDTLPDIQMLTGKKTCERLFDDLYMELVAPWGKLYKSSIVKKYLFPVGRRYEDEATLCKYYYESSKIAIGNKRLYAYYKNLESVTHTQGEISDVIWALEHRAKFFEEKKAHKLSKIAWRKVYMYCITDSLKYNGRCDDYLKSHISLKRMDIRMLVLWIIYSISPKLYKKLRKIS